MHSSFGSFTLQFFFDLTNFELLALFFAIVFVVFAEMINTAIEATVDILTEEYHPKAKIAKNVAAGAVLIAVFNSIIVGAIVFLRKISAIYFKSIYIVTQSCLHLIFVSIIAFFLIMILFMAFHLNK